MTGTLWSEIDRRRLRRRLAAQGGRCAVFTDHALPGRRFRLEGTTLYLSPEAYLALRMGLERQGLDVGELERQTVEAN